MSHSRGQVLLPNGIVKFLEYNGTVDIMQPKIFDTPEELSDNWRTNDWPTCIDPFNHKHEIVRIASSYGGGFEWDGKICLECNCLVGNLEPHDDYDRAISINHKDGLPNWWQK